ncbi:MAG: CapA family protein [Methanomassiliicoccales archaeon]
MTQTSVLFMATGDISFGWAVEKVIRKHGYDHLFAAVAPILKPADLVLANLEGPITTRGVPVAKTTRFRYHPSCLAAIKRAGIDAVCVANNHTLDYGRIGLQDTLKHLQKQGIPYMGAGLNENLAHQPLILRYGGLSIGFLAYLEYPYVGVVYDGGLATVARATPHLISKDIEQLRDKVDVVVVSFHWGKEFDLRPNRQQKRLAYLAIDAGADLILGHHPHVLQPSEIYKDRLIAYSLGNFVFAMHKPPRNRSTILQCRLSPNKVDNIEFIPLQIKKCCPQPL